MLDQHIGTPYGVKNGEMVHIAKAARGLECGCRCTFCGSPLIAKKGNRRQHHFAHVTPTACPGVSETLLHRLAIECFRSISSVCAPEYRVEFKRLLPDRTEYAVAETVLSARELNLIAVITEPRLQQLIPDIVATTAEGAVLIEIAVSHHVDRKKLRVLRRLNLPTIEITLNNGDAWLTREELRQKLIDDIQRKRWVFHPAQRVAEAKFYLGYRGAATLARRRNANSSVLWRPGQPWSAPAPSARFRRPRPVDWREENAFAENFNRKRGRYPSHEETAVYHRSRLR